MKPLRIAALIKQIPAFEAMELGPDGRIVREGLELEMNAYCRRAVSKGVELARLTGGTCTAITLGPPSAEDALREAVAWGADGGVLITDPVFAGSDTLATARALAAALAVEGPFDLVLAGLSSVDADTGQVPPELAQLLDLPFATGVRRLDLSEDDLVAGCEHDDEWVEKRLHLPAVLSCAERLCEPSKMPPEARAAVAREAIRVLHAGDLGSGPWGQRGSPTRVGEVKVMDVERRRRILVGPVAEQVTEAVRLLVQWGALDHQAEPASAQQLPQPVTVPSPALGVVLEPKRELHARELVGAACQLASVISGRVVAIGSELPEETLLGSWGADAAIRIIGAEVEEDVAASLSAWARGVGPWAVLVPGTPWGREVASRTAAALGAGLVGDAIALEVEDGRLVAWKPAFGGRTLAAIRFSSEIQMATVRGGVLGLLTPRESPQPALSIRRAEPRGRVEVLERRRLDDSEALVSAQRVVAFGQGVPPDSYSRFDRLVDLLGAERAATRKVTDQAWMPRARQVGITGHSIAPRLFIAVGAGGKFNFMVGARQAGTIVAINPDPDAPIWDWVDIGLVAPWEDALGPLERELAAVLDGIDAGSVIGGRAP